MSSFQRRMQSCVIVLLLLVTLLCPLNSRAEDVCFDEATASKMVVALEQAKITEEQLAVLSDGSSELQKQLDILRGTIKLLEDRIMVYENMSKLDKQFSDAKDKACADQIKAATPTFWDNMGKYLTGGVIGAILTAVIVLL